MSGETQRWVAVLADGQRVDIEIKRAVGEASGQGRERAFWVFATQDGHAYGLDSPEEALGAALACLEPHHVEVFRLGQLSRAELLAALARYGGHTDACDRECSAGSLPCTCGWGSTLATLAGES